MMRSYLKHLCGEEVRQCGGEEDIMEKKNEYEGAGSLLPREKILPANHKEWDDDSYWDLEQVTPGFLPPLPLVG